MNLVRGTWVGVSALLCCAVVAACGGGSAQQQVRLGFFPNLTHATALLGIRQGILASALRPEANLQTTTFNAGPNAVEALLSKSIDAVYLGPNPAVNAFTQSHGQAIRIVSGATSGGASLVVRPSINSPADLKGRKLATPGLGNTQDVALRHWLAQKGFPTTPEGGGEVSIRPQDNAQTMQTFRTRQIDGAWVPEPWATQLVFEGSGKRLVDERSLWPNGQFATTVLAVRTDFLNQHPTLVRRLIEGQIQASDFINAHPAQAQRSASDEIAAITGKRLADQVAAAAWSELGFTNDPVARSIEESAQHAHQIGLLGQVDLKGIFDLSLLNQTLGAQGKPQVPA
jgi:NitT/TauT family transport system substrate-binding protein